jgi:hypothetical protein
MPRKQKNGVRPERYVPDSLTNEDKLKQVLMLLKSRSDYEEKTFQTRKKLPSFKSKPSSHVETAKKMYGVRSMTHTKTGGGDGCTQAALKKIINKGEGRITRRGRDRTNRPVVGTRATGVIHNRRTGGEGGFPYYRRIVRPR